MRKDDDVLVGHAGERAPDVRARQTVPHLDGHSHLERHRLSCADEIADHLAVLKSHEEAGRSDRALLAGCAFASTAQPLPDRKIVGDAVDDPDGRGAAVGGSRHGPLVGRRMAHRTRRRDGMNEDGLAFDLAAREICRCAGADPHDIKVEASGRRRRRIERRVHGFERVRLAAGRERIGPVGREPLRRQRERLTVDVLQAVFPEFRLGPVMHHRLVLGAGDAAPVFVAVIAAPERDRDHLLQDLFHFEAVDLQVLLIRGRHEGPGVRLVAHVAVRIEQAAVLRRRPARPDEKEEAHDHHRARRACSSLVHDCLRGHRTLGPTE